MKQKTYFKYYGGTTVCFLWDKDTEQFFKGTTVCQLGDTYNREFGERLAKAKAVFKMRTFKANVLAEELNAIEAGKLAEESIRKEHQYFVDKASESFELIVRLNQEIEK